ncbi:MAG: ABC transporter substrate-binding protein [Promethearchaeota archaeon]
MKRKFYTTVLILILLISSFSINIRDFYSSEPKNSLKSDEFKPRNTKNLSDHPINIPFIYGVSRGPIELDPHNSWDSNSFDVIQQVCEGLYGYNYSDPEMEIIPYLATAEGVWSPDDLNYTIPLRTGVTFHDGAQFNATAVKFSFDRLAYLMDYSMSVVYSLYEVYDPNVASYKRIINRTEIVDTYTIKFILNMPYGAIDALLCFPASYILSPKSTSATTLIDTETGDLVGTGPFVYDNYSVNVEVNFHAYNNYWRGKAVIDQMKFKVIDDTKERELALINGDVHFISSLDSDYYNAFNALPYIKFLDTGKTSGWTSCLGMNNKQINVLWREAISYAIDYDYIINDIREGYVERLKSPVPDGIRYANSSFNYPVLDLPHARIIVQSMGYGIGFDIYDDAEWETAAINTPFATFNYTYNLGNKIRQDILYLLQDNLGKIGIKVTDAGMTWTEYLYRLYEVGDYSRNQLQLYWFGWVPDYNDPSNFLNSLFTNRTVASNAAQVNDPIVQQWMEDALEETDQTQREALYDNIQKRLVEEVYPWVWATVEKLYYAYHINLTGFQPNVLRINYFYPCQWNPWYISPRVDATFIVGVLSGPHDIDPHNAWDSMSYQVIDQVCEGLYGYNYSDPEMKIIPYLATAEGAWSPDGLNYTVQLRSGVTFHDGAPFNATAVKFSFDRLGYLMENDIAIIEELYCFRDGTPIINRTEVIDTYTIKFILNMPYGAFDALLCFSGSYILSPKSTPGTTLIDTETGDLIGTGPFVYDDYIPDVEINLHAYDNYWRAKADIEVMKFKIYDDPSERMAALVTGEIDFVDKLLPEWVDLLKRLANITVLDEGKTSTMINYLGMNNKQINVLWREAISYAIDYDYIINDIREGYVERLKSPVPDGIRYANSTFNYPILDLPHARLIVQSMGYGIGFDIYDDAEWETAAINTPFATFNYTYNVGSEIRENILYLLQDNLGKIGIKVTDAGMTWTEFIYRLFDIGGYGRNYLQLYWLSWVMDFNDPSNILDSMFLDTSTSNFAQVNDAQVSQWLQDAIIETDPIQREILYGNIQERLVEVIFPWAWGTAEKLYTAFHEDLTGFQQNTLERLYFYSCKWDRKLPGTFILSSDAGTPDDDGIFNLTWSASDGAINYTVYQHSEYITVVNENLSLLVDGITDLNLSLSGYSDGTYYFIVVANNVYGETLSNCYQVDILTSKSLSINIPDNLSSWETGTPHNINWTSTGIISNVKIELYIDDMFVMEISSETNNDGEYLWALPLSLMSSTLYQIKISDVSDPSIYDFSDYFEIFSPSITIIIPDDSSSWETGTSHYINWTYTGTISNVKIELYEDSLFVLEITSDTSNDGKYYWTIPTLLGGSTQYQIKISEVSDPSVYDYSEYFEIYTYAIVITVPDSSNSWQAGTWHYIYWTSPLLISNVRIELFKDDTFTMEITSGTVNDGEYYWLIPTTLEASSHYQIKITDESNPSTYDFSEYFEIRQPPSGEFPLALIITVSAVGVASVIALVTIYLLYRRKRKI